MFAICFDAIDEKQGEALTEDILALIRKLIRFAVESRVEYGSPLVSVILTCRHRSEVENIPRNLNAVAPENDLNYICIEDYDDDEMLAAIRTFDGLDAQVAQRIAEMLGSSDLLSSISRGMRIDTSNEIIDLIRHPVLCYVFSQLTSEQQHQCLVGEQQALHLLGKDYLRWFRKKAACRITNLQYGQCAEALCAAAKTFSDATAIGFSDKNWLQPVADSIGDRLRAKLLYDEAISAGLILEIDRRKKSWRWRHPWFCNFLVQNDGALL